MLNCCVKFNKANSGKIHLKVSGTEHKTKIMKFWLISASCFKSSKNQKLTPKLCKKYYYSERARGDRDGILDDQGTFHINPNIILVFIILFLIVWGEIYYVCVLTS